MSDERLDLEAELVKLARDREETRKFSAEVHKLIREGEKFRAEEMKLWRDWRLAPWVLAIGVIAGLISGLIARHL